MHNTLPENTIRVHLDTASGLPVELSLGIASACADALRTAFQDDPNIDIQIREMGTGSWWIHLLIIAGGVGAVAAGIQGLAEELRNGRGSLAGSVSDALDEYDGQRCTISSPQTEIVIERVQIQLPQLRSNPIGGYSGPLAAGPIGAGPRIQTPAIMVTRTSGEFAKDALGRRVRLRDGSIIFGTQNVPLSNIEYIDPPL